MQAHEVGYAPAAWIPSLLSGLVRIDQILFAGRALAVDGNVIQLQCFLQRYHLRVMAGERRLELVDHTLAQLRALGRSDFLQEWKQQPAADTPGHSECPVQLDRTG